MKYIAVILNIFFLTAAMYFGAVIFYKRLNPVWDKTLKALPQVPAAADGSLVDSDAGQPPFYPRDRYDVILKRNLFKIEEVQAAGKIKKHEPDINLNDLEKTKLNLKLRGTVTGGEDGENFAVIEGGKIRDQALYKKGDTVEEGAVVKKILRGMVVLNYRGEDQILEMEEKKTGAEKNSLQEKSGPAKVSESMDIKRTLIDESMSDISSLMKQVRVRPHFTAGKSDGLLLYGIQHDSLFRKMGIKNGDIIMGVDGNEIESVDDALSLYENLKTASNVKLQIKRRGRIKEIEYHVED